jgi:hypothetical protein
MVGYKQKIYRTVRLFNKKVGFMNLPETPRLLLSIVKVLKFVIINYYYYHL